MALCIIRYYTEHTTQQSFICMFLLPARLGVLEGRRPPDPSHTVLGAQDEGVGATLLLLHGFLVLSYHLALSALMPSLKHVILELKFFRSDALTGDPHSSEPV